jgi:hypothetical protein
MNSRCAWRQTSNCNHAGVRIPFHDKTCRETVQPSDSGAPLLVFVSTAHQLRHFLQVFASVVTA